MSCCFLMGKKHAVVWNSQTLIRHCLFMHRMTSALLLSLILSSFVASFCLSSKQRSSSHLKVNWWVYLVVTWCNQDMLGHNAAAKFLFKMLMFLNT